MSEATTTEMLVEKGGVDDKKAEKEIIERQQRLINEEAEMHSERDTQSMTAHSESETKEEKRRRVRELAESVEVMTTDSLVDAEKDQIQELTEKLHEIQTEAENVKEFETEKVQFETVCADEVQFEVKEDVIEFAETENSEIEKREKTRSSLSARIEKIIAKTSKKASDLEKRLASEGKENALQQFKDDMENMTEEELKTALKGTLREEESGKFTDEQIEAFLKELGLRKAKEPNVKLSKRIEQMVDDYEDEIDIKDIKQMDKKEE